MTVSPVCTERMLRRWEFCTTKKKPKGKHISTYSLLRSLHALTADDDAKQHADHEVPQRHADHDADNRNVLSTTRTMSGVPERLFDEVDPKYEDEGSDFHYCCKIVSISIAINNRQRTQVGDRARANEKEEQCCTCEQQT